MILLLEDDADRIARFRAGVEVIAPGVPLHVWRDAHGSIAEMGPLLPEAWLISLDHDLEPVEGATVDPGTGYDVVKWLITHPPSCPVIVHTSNGERGTWMMGELELEGWEHHRIYAIGDDWIEREWLRLARRLLRRRDRQATES
jgi:hypothetical protein